MKEPVRAIKISALKTTFIHKVKSPKVFSKRSLNLSNSFQPEI
jgi:hypothetical protein